MHYDVIIIGGSYAGMAAGLQLARARRTVLVVDAGLRRNRFADHSHGFLGQDGVDPGVIAETAKHQLLAYDTVTWLDGQVSGAGGKDGDFFVTLEDGRQADGARLILATGVSDELPRIDGLGARWGKSVFHCPYCHGYELDMGDIGAVITNPGMLAHGLLYAEWGRLHLFTNGAEVEDAETRALMDARGVRIFEAKIKGVSGSCTVSLEDGQVFDLAGLFVSSRNAPSSPIAHHLGCEIEDSVFGTQVKTDEMKQTSVRGVFACGDVARVPHSVSLAVADGAWAGACAHRSLVFEA